MSHICRTEEILKLLKNTGGYASGESIARALNISRTAVWKHISQLRRDGFHIEAKPRSGYRLVTSPDRLTPSQIKDGLHTSCIGKDIYYYKSTESTNKIAKHIAMDGGKHGAIFIAEEQTAGRGRLDRHWLSPAYENVLLSILFRPKLQATQVFSLTMIASVALVRSIRKITLLNPQIKWPNDIYVENRKIGGILTEFNGDQDGVNFVIVGIGLNVNSDPRLHPELEYDATSIKNEIGRAVSRVELVRSILEEIEFGYKLLKEGQISEIRKQWNMNSLVMGKTVRIISFDHVETGVAESVDEQGCLVLKDAEGERKRICSGDVSLRFDG